MNRLEYERLRQAEEAHLRRAEEAHRLQLMRANELSEERLQTMNILLAELRVMVQLLVYMVDPRLRHQGDQLELIIEFIKVMVQREMSELNNAQQHQMEHLRQQIELVEKSKINDPGRQELIKRLAQTRSNLAVLEQQKAQYGIRVPVDLVNDLENTKKILDQLEEKLAQL